MPQIEDIASAVDKSDVAIHKGVSKKMRKLYVKTTKAALNHTAVETALHKAWLENNTGIVRSHR